MKRCSLALAIVTACGEGAETATKDLGDLYAPEDVPSVDPLPSHALDPVASWEAGMRWSTLLHGDWEYWRHIRLEYEVLAADAGGTTIRAIEAGPDFQGRVPLEVVWTFDEAGRVVKMERQGAHAPANGLRTTDLGAKREDYWPGAVYAWPRFPLAANGNADGEGDQRVRRDGAIFRVDITLGTNPEAPEETHYAHMRWREGHPWYDAMRLEFVHAADAQNAPWPYLFEHLVRLGPETDE